MVSLCQMLCRKFTTPNYDPDFKYVDTEALRWLHIVSSRVGRDPRVLNH